jgi:hypothetical protein
LSSTSSVSASCTRRTGGRPRGSGSAGASGRKTTFFSTRTDALSADRPFAEDLVYSPPMGVPGISLLLPCRLYDYTNGKSWGVNKDFSPNTFSSLPARPGNPRMLRPRRARERPRACNLGPAASTMQTAGKLHRLGSGTSVVTPAIGITSPQLRLIRELAETWQTKLTLECLLPRPRTCLLEVDPLLWNPQTFGLTHHLLIRNRAGVAE